MQKFIVNCLFILLCDAVNCQKIKFASDRGFSEGDFCKDDGGLRGNCTKIQQCEHARKIVKGGGFPTVCGFNGIDPMVCCPFQSQRKGRVDLTKRKSYNACIEYHEMECPSIPAGFDRRKPIIANGEHARFGQFPYMALLGLGPDLDKARWWCGGSIISQRFVLTAAHCTALGKTNVSFIRVGTLSRSDWIRPSRLHHVQRIYKHPKYNPPSHYNDIALLYTDRKIFFTNLIRPVCLYYDDEDEGLQATIAGWGRTSYRDEPTDILQYAMVSKFSDKECINLFSTPYRKREYGFDTTTQMCYGHRGGYSDTCPGDSGGPLEVDNYLFPCLRTIIGVTSFGDKCGLKGQPGVYTRISAFLPWIESIVWPSPSNNN